LLLNIYTKDFGKIEAVARSARKAKGKLKGHLELFLLADLILANGRSIDTITSSVAAESFLNLRNNLKISFGAYYIIELADRMTIEGHKDESVFYLLKRSLLFLDGLAEENNSLFIKTPQPPLSGGQLNDTVINRYYLSILIFQIHILNLSGFSPELDKCVICSKPIKPGENYFSLSRGGVAGKECALQEEAKRPIGRLASLVPINDNTIKLMRLFQFKGNNKLGNKNSHPDKGGWGVEKCFEIIPKLKADQKLVSDAVLLMNKFIEFNIEKKVKGVDFLIEL